MTRVDEKSGGRGSRRFGWRGPVAAAGVVVGALTAVAAIASRGLSNMADLFMYGGPWMYVVLAAFFVGAAVTAVTGALAAAGARVPTALVAAGPSLPLLPGIVAVYLGLSELRQALWLIEPAHIMDMMSQGLSITLLPVRFSLRLAAPLLAAATLALLLRASRDFVMRRGGSEGPTLAREIGAAVLLAVATVLAFGMSADVGHAISALSALSHPIDPAAGALMGAIAMSDLESARMIWVVSLAVVILLGLAALVLSVSPGTLAAGATRRIPASLAALAIVLLPLLAAQVAREAPLREVSRLFEPDPEVVEAVAKVSVPSGGPHRHLLVSEVARPDGESDMHSLFPALEDPPDSVPRPESGRAIALLEKEKLRVGALELDPAVLRSEEPARQRLRQAVRAEGVRTLLVAVDAQALAEPLILLAALSFQEGTQVQLLSFARPMPLPAPAGGGVVLRAVPMDALPITEVFRRPEETALRLSSEGLTGADSDGPRALDDLGHLRFAPAFQSDTELVIGVAPGVSVGELLTALDALESQVMFGGYRLALFAEDRGGTEEPVELEP